jgi:glycosyltransferase involved in cell wall biosynthesis
MERSRVAIIVPALNESATIGAVVARVGEFGRALVVDDGSTDTTAAVARAAGAEVVRHASNRGYDAALNSGFARAAELGCAYLITIDADGQHDPAQLRDMIRYLDGGYQMVLGVRARSQRFSERMFALCARRLWSISDPLCGMKAYTLELYQRAGGFDTVGSIGCELAVRSKLGGARTIEMPIRIRERADAPRFGRWLWGNYKILRALVILVSRYGQRTRTRQ